jgi:prepilin-type N-terminal cleavage/methylation domain-containing protein
MLRTLKNSKGFTMIELFMVFAVIGILAQIAMTFMIDLRSRSFDIRAVSDGRNLITVVKANFANLDDVDYTEIDGSDIGVKTTGGGARPPVFTLSPGVTIKVTNGSESGTSGACSFEAWLSHSNGTPDAAPSETGTGRREFYYFADESDDTIATF